MDIEMGDAEALPWVKPLVDSTSSARSIVQETNAIVQRTDSYISAPAVLPAHMPRISTASDPSQGVVNYAPQEMSLILVKRNPQPPGSPSTRRRSKSPPAEKVAAQKVRLVAQEDPRREEEFEHMKKNVTLLISDCYFQLINTRLLGKANS